MKKIVIRKKSINKLPCLILISCCRDNFFLPWFCSSTDFSHKSKLSSGKRDDIREVSSKTSYERYNQLCSLHKITWPKTNMNKPFTTLSFPPLTLKEWQSIHQFLFTTQRAWGGGKSHSVYSTQRET